MESLTPKQAEAALDDPDRHIDEAIKAELEAQGWQRVGREYPTASPFNEESGRFEQVRLVTDDEITEAYLEKYGPHGFGEVRIEVSHTYDTGWPDETMVYVYMRQSSRDQG